MYLELTWKYLYFSLLANPARDSLRSKSNSLNIHSICFLGLSFSREMHDDWGSVEFQLDINNNSKFKFWLF